MCIRLIYFKRDSNIEFSVDYYFFVIFTLGMEERFTINFSYKALFVLLLIRIILSVPERLAFPKSPEIVFFTSLARSSVTFTS